MAKQKKKKRKLTPFGKFLKYSYRTILVISALIVTGFVVWNLTIKAPTVAEPPAPTLPVSPPGDNPDTPENEGQLPTPLTRKSDHFYTFLLVATDQVSGSTDTIIVASYDADNQKANLVSIPRDTLVDRRVGPYRYNKINTAFNNGEAAAAGGGLPELKGAVSELLGIPIDFHVLIDVDAFVKIVDKVGGIDFEVPVKMDYDAPDQGLSIHFEPKMYYGLTGQQVLEIARCRQNSIWSKDGTTYTLYDAYPDAEIGRTRTQQGLLKAIAKKLLNLGNLPKFVETFNESVTTNLSLSDMLWFASTTVGIDLSSDLNTATFPGRGDVTYRGVTYCYQYDQPAALEMINTMLNPYTTEVTAETAHMIQVK